MHQSKKKKTKSPARARAEREAMAKNPNMSFGEKTKKGAAVGSVGNLSALQKASATAKAKKGLSSKSVKVKPTGALKSTKPRLKPPTAAEIAERTRKNKAARKKKKKN